MSRRTGQRGSVFQKGASQGWNPEATAYGRFWIDIPGEDRRRKTVSLGVCPTRSVAKRKLRNYIEESGINDEGFFKAATAPAVTFGSQANAWIDALAKRKRKPEDARKQNVHSRTFRENHRELLHGSQARCGVICQ